MILTLLLFGVLNAIVFSQVASSSFAGTSSPVPAEASLEFLIPPGFIGEDFVGSVIKADSCETTYGIVCDAKDTLACDPFSTVYATHASNSWGLSTRWEVLDAIVTSTQCSITNSETVICTTGYSSYGAAGGDFTSYIETLASENVYFKQIPITAGASKLSNLAPCTTTGNAAAVTSVSEVFKVLVVPGAAAILAGALL